MTDKHSKDPDERWDAVNKGQTRDTQSAVDKNTAKPDTARVKGEITTHHTPEADEDEEEDE